MKTTKFVFLASLLLLFSGTLSTQTLRTIQGRVTDTNGNPLEGAVVMFQEIQAGAETNAQGEFKILLQKELPLNIGLTVVYKAYSTLHLPVTDTTKYLEITLNEDPDYSLTDISGNAYLSSVQDDSTITQFRLIELDSTIIFSLSEVYKPGNTDIRYYQLDLVSSRIYPNFNLVIQTEVDSSANNLSVNIEGIKIPNVVLPAFGPAKQRLYISNLHEGENNLSFTYKNGPPDLYRIIIKNDSFQIEKINSTFTRNGNVYVK